MWSDERLKLHVAVARSTVRREKETGLFYQVLPHCIRNCCFRKLALLHKQFDLYIPFPNKNHSNCGSNSENEEINAYKYKLYIL